MFCRFTTSAHGRIPDSPAAFHMLHDLIPLVIKEAIAPGNALYCPRGLIVLHPGEMKVLMVIKHGEFPHIGPGGLSGDALVKLAHLVTQLPALPSVLALVGGAH